MLCIAWGRLRRLPVLGFQQFKSHKTAVRSGLFFEGGNLAATQRVQPFEEKPHNGAEQAL